MGLGLLADPRAREPLRALRNDASPLVRQRVERALTILDTTDRGSTGLDVSSVWHYNKASIQHSAFSPEKQRQNPVLICREGHVESSCTVLSEKALFNAFFLTAEG
jgi:hypothetical protein